MKAARLYKKNDIRIEEIEFKKDLKSDEVLVEICYAGICGSDLHNFKTGAWISRSPSTPGHEFSGKVIKVGEDVTKLDFGDHVVADSRVSCRNCFYCNKNKFHLCQNLGFVGELNDGGFAKFSIQKEEQLIKVSKSLDLRHAALLEPLAVSMHAVSSFKKSEHNNVLIVGLGPIGVLSALYLKSIGVKNIKVFDTNYKRLNRVSKDFNFTVFNDKSLIDETNKPNYCLDASNSEKAITYILNNISKGGTVSLVGLSHNLSSIEMYKIVENGITLKGCAAYDDELEKSETILKSMSHDINKILSNPIKLDEVPKYYKKLLNYEVNDIKVLIRL